MFLLKITSDSLVFAGVLIAVVGLLLLMPKKTGAAKLSAGKKKEISKWAKAAKKFKDNNNSWI